jgi:hypothetical protein
MSQQQANMRRQEIYSGIFNNTVRRTLPTGENSDIMRLGSSGNKDTKVCRTTNERKAKKKSQAKTITTAFYSKELL